MLNAVATVNSLVQKFEEGRFRFPSPKPPRTREVIVQQRFVTSAKESTVTKRVGFGEVKFLGVEIDLAWTHVQAKKIAAFKEKVKAITRRNSPVNLEQVIADLNPVLRGFANYFRMANCKSLFHDLASWIRRRLRHKQLALWKKPARLHRRLRQLGFRGDFPFMRMASWRNSSSAHAHMAMPSAWFTELGLFDLLGVETGVLPKLT